MPGIDLSPRALRFFQLVQSKLGLKDEKKEHWRERRTKYVVEPGETLEQIAQLQLGDKRLAGLIVILNRASVHPATNTCASIEPGMELELPAPREVRVYRNNYLKSGEPKSSSPSSSDAPDSTEPESDTVVTGDPIEDGMSVIKVSNECRIYSINRRPEDAQFSVKLQVSLLGSYATISAYESFMGKSQRIIYRCDGTSKVMDVDLPPAVVKDMATSDFARNWQKYYDSYFLPNEIAPPPGLAAVRL